MPSIQDLRRANEASTAAVQKSIERLEALLRTAVIPENASIDLALTRAENELISLGIIAGHLRAADVIVAPMDPATVQRLAALETAIDRAIRDDAILNANLHFVQRVLNTVQEVRTITRNLT